MSRPTPPTGLAAVLAAGRATSAGGLRGRRLWGVLALAWLPLVFLVLGAIFAGDSASAGYESFLTVVRGVYVRLLCPVVMVFLGTGAFADEWSLGTSHYVIGSPLPRWALIVGRWLTVLRQGLQLVIPPVVLSFLVSLVVHYPEAIPEYLGELGLVVLVIALLLAALAALFVLFGLLVKRPIAVSLVYVFLFELVGGNLPTAIMSFSLNSHARNLLYHATGRERFLGHLADVLKVEPASVANSLSWLLGTVALGLALSVWRFRRRESGGTSAATSEDGAE